jgi:K+-sensing histidine kinase KdpD
LFVVKIDATLWRRVFDNILSNALKFSPTEGQINISIEHILRGDNTPADIRIRFIDQGSGIPVEHHETIFDKFRIVAAQRRDVAQVGLGLAFCKMVVDAYNGRIYVSNNQPQGSIFTVELPSQP